MNFENRTRRPRYLMRIIGAASVILGTLVGLATIARSPSAAELPRLVPAPNFDLVVSAGTRTAVLAGGCFWGIQGVFQHVNGVLSVTSGYAGGDSDTATYEQTETGQTGHAEAVRIVYDENTITYGDLLQIFFSAAHDPTQLNRQGPDFGTQYRSAVFPQSDGQASVAQRYIQHLNSAQVFTRPIVTAVETGKSFYAAEDYHQDYLVNNPLQPYISTYEIPKVEALKRLFPHRLRDEPLLFFQRD